MSGRVTSERSGGIVTLTFDQVDRHNALSHAMVGTANLLLAELRQDPDVHLLLLRGAGERAFMSGAEIGGQDDEAGRATFIAEANNMIATLGELPFPVVAVIHGFCLGAGLAVAAEADLRLAATGAQFGVPAARLGLAYPYREVARLTALVGPGGAADLLLSGRRATVVEAHRWGFVQAVHPADELDREAATLAAVIAGNAPLSLRAAKLAVRVAAEGVDRGDRREIVDRLVAGCAASEDYAEGRAAFLERRPPRFSGR